jgi:hypothetical protein
VAARRAVPRARVRVRVMPRDTTCL